ncbi:carboxypeptidase D-like [Dendronephthya gigantea]|uniref:carboxypeptidase D-like n=1 Tax=Dendronephthya gigantea TaxID=151771 RepID=UPI00106BA77F|nr:carboxypeptidase D-like [Dendronephthya gigantea]
MFSLKLISLVLLIEINISALDARTVHKHGKKGKLSVRSDVEVVSKLLDVDEFKHHSYEEMLWFMKYFASKYSDIASLYDIGESVQNRKLWVLEISGNPGKHDPGEPEVKLVGGIHGEEAISKEVLLQFIKVLCEKYDKDPELTKLVDTTRIHILPSLNPDGYAMARTKGDSHRGIGHTNAHGIDLNRNFPDQFFPTTSPEQPETKAVEKWIKSHPFVLSASLHAGSLVVTYPYDDSPSGQSVYSATPDDDVFRHLAKIYSVNHPTMHLANPKLSCSTYGQHFIDGVTNGAKWFSEPGGMQDYNYVRSNCFEVTIQLGCDKFPNSSKIETYWKENKKSLVNFIKEVHTGVKGFVKDIHGKPLAGASVTVSDRQHPVATAKDGDYWRLLVPGSYEIQAISTGYKPQRKVIEVHSDKVAVLDFALKPFRDDGEDEAFAGLYNDDPRESGKHTWSAGASRSREGDNTAPEDTKGDFSGASSEEYDDRPKGKNSAVKRPASPEMEEDARKKTLERDSEKESTQHDSTTPNPSPKTTNAALKENTAIGKRVVCHVRGKAGILKGVLKWIGYLPTLPKNKDNIVAGIRLDKKDKLGTDGSFMGKRYFTAAPKHGYFVRYKDCKEI